jgi:hypothetical protein
MTILETNPALMTVICNIQAMKAKVYPNYGQFKDKDFKMLYTLTEEELCTLQYSLLTEYIKQS